MTAGQCADRRHDGCVVTPGEDGTARLVRAQYGKECVVFEHIVYLCAELAVGRLVYRGASFEKASMSLILTTKQSTDLGRAATRCCGIIASAVVASRITGRPSGVEAWGQFLDRPDGDKHVGVFGSSAAIILSIGAPQISNDVLVGAIQALRALGEPASGTTLHRERDIYLTLKVAMATSALRAVRSVDNDCRRLEALLRARCLGGNGWGYYWLDEKRHDPVPRLIPTAFTLEALKEDRYFLQSDQLLSVLAWMLSASVPAGARMIEKIMTLRALQRMASVRGLPREITDSMPELVNEIVTWSMSRHSDTVGREETIYYKYETIDDPDCHDYMIFPVDVLALDTLANAKGVHLSPQFATRVIEFVVKNVEANSGYRSLDSGRRSVMDQLYAYDAMASVASEIDRDPRVLMNVVASRVAASQQVFWQLMAVLVVLSAVTLYAATVLDPVLAKVLFGVMSAIVASVAAAVAFQRWLDR
jgi:hypothetical protein